MYYLVMLSGDFSSFAAPESSFCDLPTSSEFRGHSRKGLDGFKGFRV